MEQNFQVRDVFNEKVVNQLADSLSMVWPAFDARGFSRSVNSRLGALSFSGRHTLIRDSLREYLPQDYSRAVKILLKALPPEIPHCEVTGFDGFIILPQSEYVAKYGLEHYDLSMQALYEMTKRFSAEGAIRAFIQRYPKKTLERLSEWAEDRNCHVRRLVSEGSRPRLPWTIRLNRFIEDPSPVLRLLEKLKTDSELAVRRSVANNLNDIAKDHPDLVVQTLRKWKRIDDEGTQWLIRHAARTLVKQGEHGILEILGYPPEVEISISRIKLQKAVVRMGEKLEFSFRIRSMASHRQNLVIDYAVHFLKANGKLAPKVFKLTTKTLDAGDELEISKAHPFRPITTRRYYAGRHMLEIQVNGTSYGKVGFELEI